MRQSETKIRSTVSFLLIISFLLLITTSFVGCGGSDGDEAALSLSLRRQAAWKEAIDQALATSDHTRGISVAVYTPMGMWTYAAGYADSAGTVPPVINAPTGTAMSATTPTIIMSISKTFISALILKQISAGLYTLDTTVADLLSGEAWWGSLNLAQINADATVRQLLTHTSGMPDYVTNPTSPTAAWCVPAYPWTPELIVYPSPVGQVWQDYGATGTFAYSNTNYVLLGLIAQVKGGDTLNNLLTNAFFTPLGLTAEVGGVAGYPANTARGYDSLATLTGNPADLNTFIDFDFVVKSYVHPTADFIVGIGRAAWSAGGLITTANQIAKWGYQLYDPSGRALTVTERNTLKNSVSLTPNGYGFGVSYIPFTYGDGTSGGLYGHGGSGVGYRSDLRYEASKRITVAIITNVNNSPGGAAGLAIDLDTPNSLTKAILNAY